MQLAVSVDSPETLAEEFSERIFLLESFTTESIRAVRREFSKQLAKSPARFVVDVALRLFEHNTFEHRFVAYELVCKNRSALRGLTGKDLRKFGRGIKSWCTVDMFACYLSGPAWREHQVSNAFIHRWARSKDRWWRRAALVSTVPLNSKAHGGSGDTKRTLKVCRMLVEDRDDMVVKAMSWALRELSKRDALAVRSFLDQHRHVIAARVAREVRNKLATGLKNPKMKAAR